MTSTTAPPLPDVTVYRVRFLEDDIYEGSIPDQCYDDAQQDVYEIDPEDGCEGHESLAGQHMGETVFCNGSCNPQYLIDEAVRILEREGLTFAASGGPWLADPDGSYISNYATGQRTETTAHLHGFTTAQVSAIAEKVG